MSEEIPSRDKILMIPGLEFDSVGDLYAAVGMVESALREAGVDSDGSRRERAVMALGMGVLEVVEGRLVVRNRV